MRKDKEEASPGADGVEEDGASVNEDASVAQKQAEENEAKSVRAFVFSTTEAFDSLQRRIDERVNKTLSAMSHLGQVGRDMDILRARVERLEKRLTAAEGRPKSGN